MRRVIICLTVCLLLLAASSHFISHGALLVAITIFFSAGVISSMMIYRMDMEISRRELDIRLGKIGSEKNELESEIKSFDGYISELRNKERMS